MPGLYRRHRNLDAAKSPYKYPDASVACGELEFKRIEGIGALVNPVVIVEVLSPSTAVRDHEAKFTLIRPS